MFSLRSNAGTLGHADAYNGALTPNAALRSKIQPPAPPPPNTQFGPYRLVDRLAVGGMAEVFRAVEPRRVGEDRLVCVKRMLPHIAAEEGSRDMFDEEARLGRMLDHPNIVGVLDFGEADGQPYLAMEYVPGCDLWRLSRWLHLEAQALPFDVCIFILRALLSALDAVHSAVDDANNPQGIVHRDVSPSNLLLSVHGDVKLGDFGIAQAQLREQFPNRSMGARAKGKLGYLAPEQVAGGAVDERADLFSAGIIAAELMMGGGQQLFRGASELAVLLAIRDANIKPFLDVLRTLPPDVGTLVVRMLSPQRDARPSSAAEILAALDACYTLDAAPAQAQLADLVVRATGGHLAETGEINLDSHPPPTPEQDIPDHADFADDLPPTPLYSSAQMLEQITQEIEQIAYVVETEDGKVLGPLSFAQTVEAITVGDVTKNDTLRIGGGDPQLVGDVPQLLRHLPQDNLGPITRDQLDGADPSRVIQLGGGRLAAALGQSLVRRDTGLWICEQGSMRKEVYLENGAPVFVTSNVASELLGEFLVMTGVLSRGELEMALAVMPRFDGKLGDTLVALGLVEPVQLFQYIGEQVQEKLLEMFLWNTGRASYYPDVVGPAERFPLHIDPWQLLTEGLRRRVAQGLDDALFEGPEDKMLAHVERVPTEIVTAELPGECAMLLGLTRHPKPLEDLLAAIDDPVGRDRDRGKRTVLMLLHLGAIRWT